MQRPVAQPDIATVKIVTRGLVPAKTRSSVTRPGGGRYTLDPFAHLEDGHVWISALPEQEELTDPDAEPRPQVVRFEPFQHQIEVVKEWIDLDRLTRTHELRFRNVHEEKSRQMGLTWLLSYISLWAISYHSVSGLMMHRREKEVDDGGSGSTVNSFMGKMRFMAENENWPDHLRPPLDFIFRLVKNRRRPTAYLIGESATADPGRGGTFSFAILDEAARIPHGEAVHASLSRACPRGRFYNSTPHGESNVYARLRKPKLGNYIYLRHHWSQHPLYGEGQHVAGSSPKTCAMCAGTVAGRKWSPDNPVAHRYPGKLSSPWYDLAVVELTDEQVASELDIDYVGSLVGRVYPEFSHEAHIAGEVIEFDEVAKQHSAWDYGVDTTAVIAIQETPDEIQVYAEWEGHDLRPEENAAGFKTALAAAGWPERLATDEWYKSINSIGDPAGEARQQATGRPLTTEYAREGFVIRSRPESIVRTITAVKRLLVSRPKKLYISPTCTGFIEHMEANTWPLDRDGNRKPGATEPKNDSHNHMMRAFAYWACSRFPPPNEDESIADATARVVGGRPTDLSYGMTL